MLKSMTAYGRGEYTSGERTLIAEIKSVNNRYRDVVLRLPKSLQALEDEIRSLVSSRVRRGRIEVFIQVERDSGNEGYDMELNLPLVKSYIRICSQLNEQLGLGQGITPDTLLQMKDVIIMKPRDVDIDEMRSPIREVLTKALDSLDVMRIQEGSVIEKDFIKRLDLIGRYLDYIEEKAPLVVEEYRERLRDKINNITEGMEIDENRLIQEVAIFSNRCDITEEIVRVKSHLEQFRNYMSMDDTVGKRLDFLIQEINREANTISSKTSNSSISGKAVEIKAELEKLREQVQNVE